MIRKFISKKYGLKILDYAKSTRTSEYFDLYMNSLNWSNDQLVSYQIIKIKELLGHAYKKVPFYTKRFNDAGFNYENFKYLDDLKLIPPLTREDLQNQIDELVEKDCNLSDYKKGSSSGSTGSPVSYYHDLNESSAKRAAIMFFMFQGGYRFGEKWINIWGNPTAVNVEWKKLSSKASKFIFNEIRFPAYKLSKESEFKNLTEIIVKNRPKFMYGYTNAIYLLAEHLKKNGVETDFIQGVFTTAENLHDYQREIIEKHIGKVYDNYGSSEISGIAAQTEFDDEYLILSPRVYLEYGDIVDRFNGARKILVTSFFNKIMPFIRYENGDLAVPSASTNKNDQPNFQRISSVEGRVSDIITLPSGGSMVVPSFFGSRMLKNISGIVQYQVIKKLPDLIEINLITNSQFQSSSEKIIIATLDEYVPQGLKYNLVFNAPIIKSKNNKFKLFVDQCKT